MKCHPLSVCMHWREECGYFKEKRNNTGQGVQGNLHYWECHYLRMYFSFALLNNIKTKRGTKNLKGNTKMILTFMFIHNQQHLEALVFESLLSLLSRGAIPLVSAWTSGLSRSLKKKRG